MVTVVAALLVMYLVGGFYIVRGNETALVRRFGRLVRNDTGRAVLKMSGLHYDLPWPLARIDRVNLNELRTLTIGNAETDEIDGTSFLQSVSSAGRSQFLTGDKNILNLQLSVQYRVSEASADDFLFASRSPERRLQRLAEATAADLISRSGVDFVHPLGLGQLREMLTVRTRRLAEQHRLGIDVEEVTINAVYPPVRVKADFLDVANARADKQKYINAAAAYAEQQLAAARGESQRTRDSANIYRQELDVPFR
jgi:membrane protease subunit HflK